MNQTIKIFRFGVEDTNDVTNSDNEPHIHDFEEMLVGKDGAVGRTWDHAIYAIGRSGIC
jgi:hypothetical protein